MAIGQWGSLACHTYCDTGHPFIIMVIFEDPWHSYLFPSDLGLSQLGFEHQIFRMQDERSNLLRHQEHFNNIYKYHI